VPAVDKFNKVPSVPISRRTPEQRAKDLENTLNWLRNKGKDDEVFDPTGEFHMLDSMLPKKNGQTPADRARDIEAALDWMRNNGVSYASFRSISLGLVIVATCFENFSKTSFVFSPDEFGRHRRPSESSGPIGETTGIQASQYWHQYLDTLSCADSANLWQCRQ
jgi:hypothetical protein